MFFYDHTCRILYIAGIGRKTKNQNHSIFINCLMFPYRYISSDGRKLCSAWFTYYIRLTSWSCLITSQGVKAKDRDKARAANVPAVPASDNAFRNLHRSPTPPSTCSCTTLTVTNFSGTRLYKHDLRPTNYSSPRLHIRPGEEPRTTALQHFPNHIF